ncbi:hypothetical protein F4859DRAFT_354911 [Xylaria cf. heliscus]|nr:hypothetical protein F4859DRAFT_354911 [Xylaria cf. heliscus]
MGSAKENHQEESGDAAPPAYDDSWQAGSQAAEAAAAADSKRPLTGPENAPEPRPTVDSPFNFPPAYTALAPDSAGPSASTSASTSGRQDYSTLPELVTPSALNYNNNNNSSSSSSASPWPQHVLIAIPQVSPQPTSPFLQAFNTAILLRRGIARETFASFLSTLSAFLSATVSERALAHAGDVGRSFNDIPKRFSKDTIAHVKGVGQHIGESAKRGNLVAAGLGAIGGVVSIPVAAAFRVVDATVRQLPAAAVGGLSRKPLSPRGRADAYVAVAQRDWFAARGLSARLCNTAELLSLSAQYRGSGSASGAEAAAKSLVNLVQKTWEMGPEGQLQALQSEFGFAPLELTAERPNKGKPLDIGPSTLWLVLMDATTGV